MTPDNNDEILRIIAGLIDRFTADGNLPFGGRFQGYAIIAGPGRIPAVIRIRRESLPEPFPEVMDGEAEVFISAALPPGCDDPPSVRIQPLVVAVTIGEESVEVNLPSRVDVRSCSWQVRNGVLDISCRKA